jgi:protein-S-isoprenylcysteine O-methyltransferase Ste14
MVAEMPKENLKPAAVVKGIKHLVGAGMYLLLLGLSLEGLTLVMQEWLSFTVPLTFEAQVVLTVPCVAGCVLGAIWFNRTLNLIKIHLLNGKNELITYGPFAYVRHPLYSTIIMTIPPLAIIWLSDLLFFIPWVLIVVISHYVVRLEERGLVAVFGEEYERYRRDVPALFPYKGAGGQRHGGRA